MTQAQRLLWLNVLDQLSSYEQSKADISLLIFHCGSFGGFLLRRLWLLWWLTCAVGVRQNWTFLWMCSRIWWCCTHPCWCAMPPLWRYVGLCSIFGSLIPLCLRSRIGQYFSKIEVLEKLVPVKLFYLEKCSGWSEVKGICCQSVSCKIGLYNFLAGEIRKTIPFSWTILKLQAWNGACSGRKMLSFFTWAISNTWQKPAPFVDCPFCLLKDWQYLSQYLNPKTKLLAEMEKDVS